MTSTPIVRTVYIVSDSTGITAETFSQSVLSQFEEVDFKPVRLPFVDTLEKAAEVAMRIDRSALEAGVPPIVFSTLVNPDILARVRQANGIFLDLFGTFVSHIEQALGLKSSHSIGRSHMMQKNKKNCCLMQWNCSGIPVLPLLSLPETTDRRRERWQFRETAEK